MSRRRSALGVGLLYAGAGGLGTLELCDVLLGEGELSWYTKCVILREVGCNEEAEP